MVETIILFVALALLAACAFIFYRNNRVYQVRMEVVDQVSILARDDIAHQRPWKWRYDAFEEISYDQMLFSIRPLRSFYKNAKCLEPTKQ